MSPAETARASDRLLGWKDISSYLGRSVRTAIRWEKELGLPVHRLRGKGDIVYAFRSEIDEWLRRHSVDILERAPDTAGETPPATPAPYPYAHAHAGWRRGLITGVCAASIVAIVALVGLPSWTSLVGSRLGPLAHLKVEADTLVALDAADRVIWQRTFQRLIADAYSKHGPITAQTRLLKDIDGDGQPEVLFMVDSSRSEHADLYCLDTRGNQRFKYSGEQSVKHFGNQVYAPPFG